MKFKCGDIAVITNTNGNLDWKHVQVVGVAQVFGPTIFYIVDLGELNNEGWTHIVMIDSCLEEPWLGVVP